MSDADVPVALEDRSQRIGDLAGRQCPGRDLVGERLEEVKVPPVDERDLDRSSTKFENGLKSAEASADDDHPVLLAAILDDAFGACRSQPYPRIHTPVLSRSHCCR